MVSMQQQAGRKSCHRQNQYTTTSRRKVFFCLLHATKIEILKVFRLNVPPEAPHQPNKPPQKEVKLYIL